MMLRNLVTSLILYERIRTTKKRASVLKPLAEKVISIGKTVRKDLAIRRMNEIVTHPNASRKILEVFVARYKNRPSGFLSIRPVGMRGGDGASLVDIVLVDSDMSQDAAIVSAPSSTASDTKAAA